MTRKTTTTLLLSASASALALAAVPAAAQEVIFTSSDIAVIAPGERTSQAHGVMQVRLPGGGMASFVDAAEYRVNADGSVDLYRGTVTVAGAPGASVAVRMPDGVAASVAGAGSAASFTVGPNGRASGHVLTGSAAITRGGTARTFDGGEMWSATGDDDLRQVVSNGAAPVPDGAPDGGELLLVADMEEGGVLAAAENGLPTSLGDALAAAGASGDVLAAARRVEAAGTNPALDSYPTGDLALLVQHAAGLSGWNGGQPFPAAGADIVRTYLSHLQHGGTGANFLAAYAGFLGDYLDLIRAGALPSSFEGAPLADINAWLGWRSRLGALGQLAADDRALAEAYLAFINGGGNPDLFASRYTDLVHAYFNFIRGGGDPLAFSGASQQLLGDYIAFLAQSGLSGQLSEADRTLLAAYLANGGLGFTTQYRAALGDLYSYLAGGRLPSGYEGLSGAQLRQYLETLQTSGLFDLVLGEQAGFWEGYLAHLRAGGAPDGWAGLNANIFSDYADALGDYYAFLAAGNLPSTFEGDPALLAQYLRALQQSGALARFLGESSGFWEGYLAHLASGGAADGWAGLNANIFAGYAGALDAYYDYLLNGGSPSAYQPLSQSQIAAIIAALEAQGATGGFLDELAEFYTGYAAYLAGGGDPDVYTGLPVLNLPAFADALNAYAAFLNGGGLPSGWSGAQLATLANYLAALANAGQLGDRLGGNAALLNAFFAHLGGGGAADLFTGLPLYGDYADALSAYFAFLNGGGLPDGYGVLTPAQIQQYLTALAAAGGLQAQLGDLAGFFTQYFAFISVGGNPQLFSGLPAYGDYADALSAYFAFLNGGGLPGDYAALTQAQVNAYLAALNAAGGFELQLGEGLADLVSAYFAFISGGGAAGAWAGLPAYAGYVEALNAYYAFLAGGGLPAAYTALTPAQISAYLAALSGVQGGFGAFAGLNNFFGDYYAFLAGGGDPMDYAGIPAYGNYLNALNAFYAFLLNGGLPSAYTALTQAQVEAYLAALSNAGLLDDNYTGNVLGFWTDYLAYLGGSGDPDDFANLPDGIDSPPGGLFAAAFSAQGGREGAARSAEVSAEGEITQITFAPPSGDIALDYDSGTLREHGRIGNTVAWTRRELGNANANPNFNHHLLVGTPAVNLPASGTVNFRLLGGTAPTNALAAAGEIGHFSGDLAVAFGTTARVALDMDVHVGTRGWNVATTGGIANPGQSGLIVDADGSFGSTGSALNTTGIAGNACTGFCVGSVFGSLFGDGASHAGFAYLIDDQSSGGRSYVNGVAVFGQNGTAISGIGTMPDNGGGGGGDGAVVRAVNQPGSFTSATALTAITGVWTSPATGVSGFMHGPASGTNSYDGANGLSATTITGAGSFSRNSAQPYEVQGNAKVLIGRWSNGQDSLFTLSPNQALHYVVLAPLANPLQLPTGTATYNLIAGTSPTSVRDVNAPGTFEATLAIAFGTSPKVGMEGRIVIADGLLPGYTYTFGNAGGVATPNLNITINASTGAISFQMPGTASNGNAGSITLRGGMADEYASQLGLIYSAGLYSNNGSGTFQTSLTGAAIFGRSDLYPDAIVAGTPIVPAPPRLAYAGGFGPAPARVDFVTTLRLGNGSLLPGSETGFDATAFTINPTTGGLESYTRTGNTTRSRNSMSIVEASGNADTLIGRWTGGTNTGANPFTLNANQGFHYMLARPVAAGFALPSSGTIHYDLLAATRPTMIDGSVAPGGISADMAIAFGVLPRVAFEATLTMPGGHSRSYATVGGIANPGLSETAMQNMVGGNFTFALNGTNAADCTTSACRITVRAVFSGDTDQIGATYIAANDAGDAKALIGALIFGNGTSASPPPASAGESQPQAALSSEWSRWEAPADVALAQSAALAPGLDALAARGISFSDEQLGLLAEWQAGQRAE